MEVAAVQLNLTNMLGINGEFAGYGNTQWTQEVTTPVSTPNGVIPLGPIIQAVRSSILSDR